MHIYCRLLLFHKKISLGLCRHSVWWLHETDKPHNNFVSWYLIELFLGAHSSVAWFNSNTWKLSHAQKSVGCSVEVWEWCTVYPNKYAHGFCFAVLCCGYTLTDFHISIRLTSLALWQSNDCPSASKATLMNMDKNFMWIHYERLHNHNKAKHNKTVCIFLGIYCK